MKKIVFLFYCFILLALSTSKALAQDPQLSQIYATPLLISPAFAGINGLSKVNFIHRNQWPNLSSNYQYSAITADLGIEKYNSGLGLVLSNDVQFANLRTTTVGLQYAYHVSLDLDKSLSFGMQGAYVNRGVDRSSLLFGDQLSSILTNGSSSATSDPLLREILPNKNYLDLSVGTLINAGSSWFGLTVDHINSPNRSLVNNSNNSLPMKYSVQIGTKLLLEESYYTDYNNLSRNREKSFSPVLHYKRQGEFDQLDIGAYLTYSPMVLGAWYRGLPIRKDVTGKYGSSESAVILLGYVKDNFSLGYSYDLTISSLNPSSGGAHEITLAYVFDLKFYAKKSFKNKFGRRLLACPKI